MLSEYPIAEHPIAEIPRPPASGAQTIQIDFEEGDLSDWDATELQGAGWTLAATAGSNRNSAFGMQAVAANTGNTTDRAQGLEDFPVWASNKTYVDFDLRVEAMTAFGFGSWIAKGVARIGNDGTGDASQRGFMLRWVGIRQLRGSYKTSDGNQADMSVTITLTAATWYKIRMLVDKSGANPVMTWWLSTDDGQTWTQQDTATDTTTGTQGVAAPINRVVVGAVHSGAFEPLEGTFWFDNVFIADGEVSYGGGGIPVALVASGYSMGLAGGYAATARSLRAVALSGSRPFASAGLSRSMVSLALSQARVNASPATARAMRGSAMSLSGELAAPQTARSLVATAIGASKTTTHLTLVGIVELVARAFSIAPAVALTLVSRNLVAIARGQGLAAAGPQTARSLRAQTSSASAGVAAAGIARSLRATTIGQGTARATSLRAVRLQASGIGASSVRSATAIARALAAAGWSRSTASAAGQMARRLVATALGGSLSRSGISVSALLFLVARGFSPSSARAAGLVARGLVARDYSMLTTPAASPSTAKGLRAAAVGGARAASGPQILRAMVASGFTRSPARSGPSTARSLRGATVTVATPLAVAGVARALQAIAYGPGLARAAPLFLVLAPDGRPEGFLIEVRPSGLLVAAAVPGGAMQPAETPEGYLTDGDRVFGMMLRAGFDGDDGCC